MRTHFAFTFFIAVGAVGCGAVDDGVCPGAQDDNVACTVDVCNMDNATGNGAWAHIPDDSVCGAGMRCDPTAGCVASGTLNGNAYLFGHTDHSGITVSIEGVEGATATTDAMGKWSLAGVPAGIYTVTFTKAKYISQSQAGIGVNSAAAASPDDVTLTHGSELGIDAHFAYPDFYINGLSSVQTYQSPDKKHVVTRYTHYLNQTPTEYRAYRTDDQSKTAVALFSDPNATYPFYVANTHVVWTVNNQTVWSRALDGGPPVILGSAFGNDSLNYVGTPGPYVVLRKIHNTGVYDETTLYVVKIDGSTPMGSPVYTQPDINHTFAWLVNNDTHALFAIDNSSNGSSTPSDAQANTPLHRIDLAAGTKTDVNTGFATYSNGLWSVSPDKATVFAMFRQPTPNDWYRSYIIPISGSAGPALGANYGAAATMYSDYPSTYVQWVADNSAVVYASTGYSGFEGGLKSWPIAAATSTQLVATGNYYFNSWSVHNKVVVYRSNSAAATATLHAVAAVGASPTPYNLDISGFNLDAFAYDDSQTASSYLVWTQSVSAGDATKAKIYSVVLNSPLVAAPSTVQLGGILNVMCGTSNYEAVLSDRTYWQLCKDTGTLSGFAASTTTAGATTTMVRPGLIGVPDGDRVAYRRYDGKLYSSPNAGAMADVKLVGTTWDGAATLKVVDKWLMYTDTDGNVLRASNSDGSAIDEPLSSCVFAQGYSAIGGTVSGFGQPATDTMKTHAVVQGVRCTGDLYGEFSIPTANLP